MRHRWWCLTDDDCTAGAPFDSELEVRQHLTDRHGGRGAYSFGPRPHDAEEWNNRYKHEFDDED